MEGWALLYLILLGASEALAPHWLRLSLLLHALLFAALMGHYLRLGPTRADARLLPALALVPLMRLLSVAMPLRDTPVILWFALVGAPLFAAVVVVTRFSGTTAEELGLRLRHAPLQALVALCGLLLSLPAYVLLRPAALIEPLTWPRALLGAVILFLFSGLLEELLFRGLIQRHATALFGDNGILFAWLAYTVTLAGYTSPWHTVTMAIIALLLGYWRHLSRSLWGAILAHTFLNVGMLIVGPHLIG